MVQFILRIIHYWIVADEEEWTKVVADETVHWLNISGLDRRTEYEMRVFASNGKVEAASDVKYVRTGGEGWCNVAAMSETCNF